MTGVCINAQRAVDRFHIVKNLNEVLAKARRAIQKDADEMTKEMLKGCRWLLVKNRENLSQEQQKKLPRMLGALSEDQPVVILSLSGSQATSLTP